MLRRTLTVVVLTATATTALAQDTAPVADTVQATAHDIKLNRPLQTGQHLDFKGECMLTQRTSGVVQGTPIEGQTIKYVLRMTSDMEIHEVDVHGRPTNVTHTLKTCVITMDDAPLVQVEPGKRMTVVSNGPQSEIEVESMVLNGQMLALFKLVASLDGDGVTEDEMFGSSQPRRVGDSWTMNVAATLPDIQRQTAQEMTADQLSGESKLLGVVEHDSQTCLKIYSTLTTEDVIPGLEALPEGARLEEAGMQARFEGLYPKDHTQPWLARSGQMDIHLLMVQPGLGTLRSDTQMVLNVVRSLVGGEQVTTAVEESR